MTNWNIDDLRSAFKKVGLSVEIEVEQITTPMPISTALLNRWFSKSTTKPSYASYLAKFLADDEIAIAQQLLTNKLLDLSGNKSNAQRQLHIYFWTSIPT